MATRAIVRHSVPDRLRLMVYLERWDGTAWVRREEPDYLLLDQEATRNVRADAVRVVLEEEGSTVVQPPPWKPGSGPPGILDDLRPPPEVDPEPPPEETGGEPPPEAQAAKGHSSHSSHPIRRKK